MLSKQFRLIREPLGRSPLADLGPVCVRRGTNERARWSPNAAVEMNQARLFAAPIIQFNLLIVLLTTLAGCLGSNADPIPGPHLSLASSIPDRAYSRQEKSELLDAAPFRLRYQEAGDGPDRIKTVLVQEDGTCVYLAHTAPQLETLPDGRAVYTAPLQRVRFRVEPRKVDELRRLLAKVDVLGLKREYHGNARDGLTLRMHIEAGGVDKKLLCQNHFPAPVRDVAEFIYREVIPGAELTSAEVFPFDGPSPPEADLLFPSLQ